MLFTSRVNPKNTTSKPLVIKLAGKSQSIVEQTDGS